MLKMLIAGIAGVSLAGALIMGAGAAGEARVRVIHASPDAPNVDVYANGAAVLTDVAFGASSGYLAVPSGQYEFQVFPAGADPKGHAVLTLDASLQANADYTVVAQGAVSNIEAGVYVDDNTAPVAGKAHVYVVHASPDAPAVDVAVKGGPVLVSDLAFGERAGPLPVDAGTYDLEVRPAGSTDVALPLNGVTLEAGKVYTFVATGFLSGEPTLTVLPFAEEPAAAVTTMTPPSTGDAGLASGSGSNSTYLFGGAVLVLMVLMAGAARRRTSRN
jgi:hypothetical protein